jgi:hypothetical protein
MSDTVRLFSERELDAFDVMVAVAYEQEKSVVIHEQTAARLVAIARKARLLRANLSTMVDSHGGCIDKCCFCSSVHVLLASVIDDA